MRVFPLFDLEKVLFPYLPSKLRQEVEIWYVHLIRVLDLYLGGPNLSAPFHPLTVSKKWFFGRFFSFFSSFKFVPHVTPLQIELGS